MNLLYRQSVTVCKITGKDKRGEPLYGEGVHYDGVELTNQPLFLTENGKRLIKMQVILTIYEALPAEGWISAKVFDENHNLFYVNEFKPIHDVQDKIVKCQLILIERSG